MKRIVGLILFLLVFIFEFSLYFPSFFKGNTSKTGKPVVVEVLKKPEYNRYVTDCVGVLPPGIKDYLMSQCYELDNQSSIELAVVIVRVLTKDGVIMSKDTYPIETYSHKLLNDWGIGKKGKDNGILFIVETNSKKAYIVAGDGLKTVLDEKTCADIVEKECVMDFNKGNWKYGIIFTVRNIIDKVYPSFTYKYVGNRPVKRGVFGGGKVSEK